MGNLPQPVGHQYYPQFASTFVVVDQYQGQGIGA